MGRLRNPDALPTNEVARMASPTKFPLRAAVRSGPYEIERCTDGRLVVGNGNRPERRRTSPSPRPIHRRPSP